MSGGEAVPARLPLRAEAGGRVSPGPLGSVARRASLDPVIARLCAFAGLAAYATSSWIGLVEAPPRGRAALAVAAAVGAAASLAWAGRRLPRIAGWAAAVAITIAAAAVAAVAIGLPARLLAPWHWSEFGDRLGGALEGLGTLSYPYRGGAEWSRLVLLLGAPLGLGLGLALAFWPARRLEGLLRMSALIVLVSMYGTGATVSPPGRPLVHGLILLLLVAAWLWLPGLHRRAALACGGLVLGAGLIALPIAARMDGSRPWLDYRHWDWSGPVAGGESFDWNPSYGRLDWTRTGETLLEVQSDAPYYWRTVVLDRFDGYRWLESTAGGDASAELPRSSASSSAPPAVRLSSAWIHNLTFTIRGLSSQLVVGAGTPLGVKGLDGVKAIEGGLAMPSNHPLGDGDSYTMRAYIPDPTAGQMAGAPRAYPRALAPFTQVVLPRSRTFPPSGSPGAPNQSSTPSTRVTFQALTVPFWGAPGAHRTDRVLAGSAYGGVYRLARRVTAGARNPYEAVQDLERYLRSSYTYSEIPPERQLPLRAFLLRDGIGYCQQFSGAMALMLRMIGIPARVASGFSPGSSSQEGTYVVRDFDAHSWVEVYFNGIGWVSFDPTPAAAPAQSQATGLGLHALGLPATGRPLPAQPGGKLTLRRSAPAGAASPAFPARAAAVGAALLSVLGFAVAFGLRAVRSRSLDPDGLLDAQLRELAAALARLRSPTGGGATLLELERRLEVVAGPASSAYAGKLRAARYAPGEPQPPSPGERRSLRRELSRGLGLRGRLRGLAAIPPGGPARLRRPGWAG